MCVRACACVRAQEYMDGKRADAWRHAACMAAALPTSLRDSLLDKLVPLGPHPPGETWCERRGVCLLLLGTLQTGACWQRRKVCCRWVHADSAARYAADRCMLAAPLGTLQMSACRQLPLACAACEARRGVLFSAPHVYVINGATPWGKGRWKLV